MKIISKIFYGLFVTALLGIAGLLFATMFSLPFANGVEVKIVKSGSMHPAIPTGSLIIVGPAKSYSVGEVITFGEDTPAKIPTTHRIVAIDGDVYTTKGDANEEADAKTTTLGEIIGKVWLHVPYAGYILDFARQPWGFALLIGIPALIIIFDELWNIFGEVRKLRRPARAKKSLPSQVGFSSDIRFSTVVRERKESFLRKATPMFVFTALMLAGNLLVHTTGSTLSYFSDIETSRGNTFIAGTWEQLAVQVETQALTLTSFGDVAGTTTPEATSTEPVATTTEPEATSTPEVVIDEGEIIIKDSVPPENTETPEEEPVEEVEEPATVEEEEVEDTPAEENIEPEEENQEPSEENLEEQETPSEVDS